MLYTDKPVNREVIGAKLLIKLFRTEFLFPAVLEEAYNSQHQKEDAKKIQEYSLIQIHGPLTPKGELY